MGGEEFGNNLKKLRKAKGISSKELSRKVGKAVTYVSQLERGLIKSPDFDTCVKLLGEVGIEEEKIEGVLEWFGIRSPEVEAAEITHQLQRLENEERWARENPEEHGKWIWEEHMESAKWDLGRENDMLHNRFSKLINSNFDTAEVLVGNLHTLTNSPAMLSFFCALMKNPYHKLSDKGRSELLSVIQKFFDEGLDSGKEDV